MSDQKIAGDGIDVRNLEKSFGGQRVLTQVNLCLPAGGKAVLVGPSGAGKSTLLRIIAGLELPDAGEVYLHGRLATTPAWSLEPCQRDLGFVFQQPTLWPHMTVRENILFGLARLPRQEAVQRVAALLAQAGISQAGDKYPEQLSGGEAKRAALVRSIAPRPRILLVDEPLANLDELNKGRLLELVLELVEDFRMTLLYVTHDATEVARIGGSLVCLRPGEPPG